MSYFSKKFQSLTGGKRENPHDIGRMVTQKLPIPDVGGGYYYVQFVADCQINGLWTMKLLTNCELRTRGLNKTQDSVKAIRKQVPHVYMGKSGREYDIEAIFIIMQELEEAHLSYDKNFKKPSNGNIPDSHYSHVFKTLPPTMQETLICMYNERKLLSPILGGRQAFLEKARKPLPPPSL